MSVSLRFGCFTVSNQFQQSEFFSDLHAMIQLFGIAIHRLSLSIFFHRLYHWPLQSLWQPIRWLSGVCPSLGSEKENEGKFPWREND